MENSLLTVHNDQNPRVFTQQILASQSTRMVLSFQKNPGMPKYSNFKYKDQVGFPSKGTRMRRSLSPRGARAYHTSKRVQERGIVLKSA